MAPDLNAVSGSFEGGKWDYSTPGSSGYNVPNTTYDDPQTRPLRVITIGAGYSGILLSHQLKKYCANVAHTVYEKNADIGGTWLENRYPGCACDIPSHAYTLSFAPNPDWPRFFSYAPDIWGYLDKVCDVFGLREGMRFGCRVVGCVWDEARGLWTVTVQKGEEVWEDEADLVLYATGILNHWRMPEIEGLDRFKGRVCHTASWPSEYQQDQWKGDKVAVIGSGASSIQTVPNMQPHVKHLDVFVRTGVWFVQIANNFGANHEYTQEQRDEFRRDPRKLIEHAKSIEDQVNGMWGGFYADSEAQQQMQDMFRERMKEFLKDERLLKGFTPNFAVGCRRITPGDPYMEAIQKENVDVHFTHVQSITEDGLIGGDGVERKVDTIVCATGFDVAYRPRFPVIGRNGVNLQDKWKTCPEGYLGLGVPDMPNFIMFVGPSWPVENGAVTGPLQGVSEYAVQMIKKMQRDDVKSWVPKQDVTDAFNEHVQEWIKHTVWKDNCRSWYRNNETGRVNAVWPGSSLHYMDVIAEPRYEDFEMEYRNKRNMWAHLGMGYSMKNATGNFSPYLQVENIEPAWLQAVGSPELVGVGGSRFTPLGAWREHGVLGLRGGGKDQEPDLTRETAERAGKPEDDGSLLASPSLAQAVKM